MSCVPILRVHGLGRVGLRRHRGTSCTALSDGGVASQRLRPDKRAVASSSRPMSGEQIVSLALLAANIQTDVARISSAVSSLRRLVHVLAKSART